MIWILTIVLLSGEQFTTPMPTHDACLKEEAQQVLNSNVRVAFCRIAPKGRP